MAEEAEAKEQSARADKIVRNHMIAAVASGVVLIPLVGIGLLGGVQLRMLSQLAKL